MTSLGLSQKPPTIDINRRQASTREAKPFFAINGERSAIEQNFCHARARRQHTDIHKEESDSKEDQFQD